MPPIKHTQLFDFPAYEAAIKDARIASEEFGKSIEGTIGRIQKDQKALNAELREYATILKTFNALSTGAASGLKAYNTQIDNNIANMTELKALQKGLAQVVDVSKASVQQLEAELKGLSVQYKALKPGQADYHTQMDLINKRIKEIVPTVNAFNQALKNSKKAVDTVEGSYKNMQAQLVALRNNLRLLPGAFDPVTGKLNKANKEAVALSKEIIRLDGALKQADKTMGLYVRNVGNYQSAFKGFGNSILQTVGSIIGIQSAFEAVKFVFNTNLQFDSLNAAIKQVSGSTEEFAINQSFLRKTADQLGLEIIGLSTNFKNFYAAAVTAGLGAQQTRDIFEKVSRVGANLKLSQDNVNGVFTAFGQIISKGKVQAEELRGQIGERLPGAFAVAAKAIGVTQAELNKMLQDGKVISSEFLPKFADELEKTFGGGTERVEGMQAAVNRFSNALKDIASDDSGGLNRFFTKLINFFTDALKGAEKFFQFVFDKIDPAAAKMQLLSEAFGDAYNDNIGKSIPQITKALKENTAELDKQLLRLKKFRSDGEPADVVARQLGIAQDQAQRVSGIMKALDAKRNPTGGPAFSGGSTTTDNAAKEKAEREFKDRIRKEQDLLKNLSDLKEIENERAFVNGEKSETAYQERKLEIVGEYAGMAAELEQKLGANSDKARLASFKELFAKAQLEFDKFIQKSSPKASTVKGPARADTGSIDTEKALGAGFVGRFDAEIAARELKIKTELEMEEEKQKRLEELQQMSIETAGQAAFALLDIISNAQDAKYEKRITQLETERDRELAIAGQNAAARDRIEAEYNRKVAREKNKQAKAQRTAALFEVAINTAIGIAKTFATLGWPLGIPGAAFVLAQGVIQAAVISAKPLPAFKKGTSNAPKGHALVNEEGFELIEKNGRMRVASGRNQIVNLEGGEKIHTHSASKTILSNIFKTMAMKTETGVHKMHAAIAGSLSQMRHNEQVLMMEKALSRGGNNEQMAQAFERAVGRIPITQVISDERGIITRQKHVNQTITYLNKQHSI